MNNNVGKTIEQIIEKEKKTIDEIVKKEAYPKVVSIKRDIYGFYTVIVRNSFHDTFSDIYGNGYDIESLDKALKFMSGSSLIPEFYFDENEFHFNSELENITRKFNQNSRKYASFGNMDNPDFYLGDLENFDEEYDEDIDEEDIYDDMMYEYLQMSPVNKTLVEKTRYPITDAYKIARDKALVAFNSAYISQIKPRIYRKYGIKIL